MVYVVIFMFALLDPIKIIGAVMIAFFGLKSSKVIWKRLLFILIAELALILLVAAIARELRSLITVADIIASLVWLIVFLVPLWKRQRRRDLIRIADEREFGTLPKLPPNG